MSSRGLPGFLRRSLRIDYEEEDEEESEEESGEDEVGTSSSSVRRDNKTENDHNGQKKVEAGVKPNAADAPDVQAIATVGTAPASGEQNDSPPEQQKKQTVPQNDKQVEVSLNSAHTAEQPQTSGSPELARSKLSDSWQDTPAPSLPPAEGTPKLSYRETQFEKVLEKADVVSLTNLQKLSWNGIPPKYRALAWKILLGYVPTNVERRKQALRRKRSEYRDAMAQHYDIPDDTRTLQEQETLRQVLVDVPRTAPDVPLFRNDRIKRVLTRLLYIWAMRHPASSYVQGINDLATPLVTVFLADYYQGQDVLDGHVMNHLSDERLDELEADVYWCLTNLLAGIQDHYTSDQPGVQRMVMRLEELVNRIDSNLSQHLREAGVQFLQFAFKWMNCLLLREFHLRAMPRLWDTYISEKNGFEDFHVYVCAAFLCQFSSQLQEMGFDELFGFFQEMPTSTWTDLEIEMLLSQAYVLSTLFGGSEAHLSNTSQN